MVQVELHAAVDLKVCLLPLLPYIVLVNECAIEKLVVRVESDEAVVAVH